MIEYIFGAIYGNKAKRSLEMIICGLCTSDMVIIINLIMIVEDQLDFK